MNEKDAPQRTNAKTQPTKKKAPIIKQTLTSIYRLAKSNPLLVKGNTIKTGESKFKNVHLPDAVTSISRRDSVLTNSKPIDIRPVILTRTINKNDAFTSISRRDSVLTNSKPTDIRPGILTSTIKKPQHNSSSISVTHTKKPPHSSSSISVTHTKKPPQNPPQNKRNFEPKKAPKKLPKYDPNPHTQARPPSKPRRSLSAQHYNRKRQVPRTQPEQMVANAEMTQSLENINVDDIETKKKFVTFKSPTMGKRRSVYLGEFNNSVRQNPQSTPKAARSDLHEKLNHWLSNRGKSISSFHHLKCFGIHQQISELDDEDKENVETPLHLEKSDSYEALHIDLCKNVAKDGVVTEINELDKSRLKNVVKDALEDLHKLIIDGYPLDQCETWLGKIRQKYKEIEEEPQYWESRAAIEQSRGNISLAVECYRTAIVKGAEVHSVDKSLDHLLEKFSLLNINTSIDVSGEFEKRGKQFREVRNIFKSSIIQFAVQERTLKKLQDAKENDVRFTATPVRRSTRQSRSSYVSTPRVRICNSLQELEPSIQNSLSFQKNSFLQ